MTQETFNIEAQLVARGRFWRWVLKKALPFIWENRAYFLALLKRNEKEERDSIKIQGLMAGCDKNRFDDPHYGELGEYDNQCNWHPWT